MDATLAFLPGDGVGPEVSAQALRVLRAVERRGGHTFDVREALIGGVAIDACGSPLPEDTLALCRAADAVFLGAVGGPRWDHAALTVRPEQGLLRLRSALGVFANLRPVRVHPRLAHVSPLRPELLHGVDLLVVRELTGGIYFGEKRRDRDADGAERASDTCTYTTHEIERVVRVAAALARERSGRLTSVDKANVMETSRLWRAVTTRVVRDEFPDVRLEHMLVDACALHLIRRPAAFDVIVTENLFGDVLSDEAAVLAASIGMLPSASLRGAGSGARAFGLYEPVHGSAPDLVGRNAANPAGAILSIAMLLRWSLGLPGEARAVERAVDAALTAGVRTEDIAEPGAHAATTEELGRAVAEHLMSADEDVPSLIGEDSP
jgi:3-isopropylmalate dehydrogenase